MQSFTSTFAVSHLHTGQCNEASALQEQAPHPLPLLCSHASDIAACAGADDFHAHEEAIQKRLRNS